MVPGNARALRFYRRQGWVDRGRFDNPAFTDGGGTVPVPTLRYEKDLTRYAAPPAGPVTDESAGATASDPPDARTRLSRPTTTTEEPGMATMNVSGRRP